MDTQDTSKDEYLRTEFARAFGWFKRKGQYDYYNEENPRTPSWEEIFIEVGRMLNRSQTLTDTYQIGSIERRMNDLEQYINSKKDQVL